MKRIVLLLSLILPCILPAQNDSSRQKDNNRQDSLLIQKSQQLQQITALRIADSVRKAELEQQISSLHLSDNLKKNELLQELAALQKKDSIQLAQQKQKIDSLRRFVKGVPVIFFQDTIMVIYDRQGSFSPRERAVAIADRLDKLAHDYFFQPDSIAVMASDATTDLVYNELVIMGISENDALWMQMPAAELAQLYKVRISQQVKAYRQATSWQTIVREIALSVLVIVVVVFIFYATGKGLRWLKGKIHAEKGKRIKGISIKGYKIFNEDRAVSFLSIAANTIRWVILLIVLYITLLLLFGIFPWTRKLADSLLSSFLTPLRKIVTGTWHYLPNLVTIAVICFVFRLVLKGIRFLKEEVETGVLRLPGFYADWAAPTYQIIRVLALAFMLIVIFPYLPGSNSPVFKGVSVFMGVLFTFGSAGALGNIVSGVVLTYMRSFKIGDRVKIGDVTGDVIEKSLLVTRVRTIKNEIISIPNATIMNSHTVNYSSDAPDKGLIIHATVTVGYDTHWSKVHDLLLKSAAATPLLENTPPPFVLQVALDEFYVSYEINAYTKHPNKQAGIYSDLYQRILDLSVDAGIEIMSPHYYVVKNGQQPNEK
ncbi:Mechanosensitive ion channel [Filimonas lacunae]|uniref:Mechanosensitive ion channel n=1 Tax=Filimonas lacunae TaxID=477680 RepID=A0A173MHA7_9BACT|nr:mechanosensitive ion channel family protein [Filimonas lacunae]BAV06993.1 mechanosensitive ion channel family protein [Filimonas lacunae]SIS96726.1 Mechanosensitive ion channel [Filimonas lacunae]